VYILVIIDCKLNQHHSLLCYTSDKNFGVLSKDLQYLISVRLMYIIQVLLWR